MTEGARRVAELFLDPPEEAEWRPVLRGVSRLAFATLPPHVREMYGVRLGPGEARADACDVRGDPRRSVRCSRRKYRYIAPYQDWRLRSRGRRRPRAPRRVRRSLGIRLGGLGARLARRGGRGRPPARHRRRAHRLVGAARRARSRPSRGPRRERSRSGSSRTRRRTRAATSPDARATPGSTSAPDEIVTAVVGDGVLPPRRASRARVPSS